ncbi:MAG TPA: hypothetical protein VLB44_06140, partial [Kofleriaceae bacterium]|nr:hypothetical protein [Kofleriaceae bacterium]
APSLVTRGDQLFENSGGNPLFASELMAAWQSGGATGKTFGIDDAIRAHVALLSPTARHALSLASVLGRLLDRGALRALGVDVVAIDEALASGLLVAAAPDRLRFDHVLIRDELYRELPTQTRRELHRAAAHHFVGDPEQAVHHSLAAADLLDPGDVLETVLAAMRAASGRLAFSDAAALGMRSLGLAGASWSATQQAALQVAVGEALIIAGDADAGRAICAKAAALAIEHADPELLARAALVHASEHRIGRHEASIALLRQAVARSPSDARVRVQLLAKLATAIIPATEQEGDEPLRLAREALAAARQLGDPETLLATLCAVLSTFPQEFTLGERLSLSAEAIPLARRMGQLARVLPMLGWTVASWLELGQLDAARAEARAAQELIATLPAHHAWRGELLGALFAALDGMFDEAARIARRVFATGSAEGAHQAAIMLMVLPYLHGDRAAFAEDDGRVLQAMTPIPGSQIFLGIADAICGRVDRVRAAIAKARALDLSALPGAAQLGWPVVVSRLTEHAEAFYAIAAASASRSPLMFGPNALGTFGPVDLLAAQLAHLLGRLDLVHEHMARARAYAELLGAPAFLQQVGRVAAAIESTPRSEPAAKAAPAATHALMLERRGELWAIGTGGRELLLEHRRGFDYLAALVAAPHREIHVLELAGIEEDSDAGPVLDAKTKRAYRERAEALRDQLAEAERNADLGRAEAARAELEALTNELARALGLGGRDRRAGAAAERARINVQRRLSDVLRRINDLDVQIGRHLELSVKTGTFCRYAPTWEQSFPGRERP